MASDMTLLMGESLGMEAPLANDVALVAIKTPKANLHARTEQSGRLTLTTLRLSSKCIRGKFGDVTTLNVVSQGIEVAAPSAPGLPQWNNIHRPRITKHFGVWLQ